MTKANYRLYWLKHKGLLKEVLRRTGGNYDGTYEISCAFCWDCDLYNGMTWSEIDIALEKAAKTRRKFKVELRNT